MALMGTDDTRKPTGGTVKWKEQKDPIYTYISCSSHSPRAAFSKAHTLQQRFNPLPPPFFLLLLAGITTCGGTIKGWKREISAHTIIHPLPQKSHTHTHDARRVIRYIYFTNNNSIMLFIFTCEYICFFFKELRKKLISTWKFFC